jgi:hypothetical protein
VTASVKFLQGVERAVLTVKLRVQAPSSCKPRKCLVSSKGGFVRTLRTPPGSDLARRHVAHMTNFIDAALEIITAIGQESTYSQSKFL